MELNPVAPTSLAQSISFSGKTRCEIRSLSGFEKHHRLPLGDSNSRLRFFAIIGSRDIDDDLDSVFGKLRSSFGFKRKQLKVAGPIDGSGSIATPAFDYRVEFQIDFKSDEHVFVRRTVNAIREPQLVFSRSFDEVFGESLGRLHIELAEALDIHAIIDHVEDDEASRFTVSYDKDGTWCEISGHDYNTIMRIEQSQISVQGRAALSPGELIKGYRQLQQRFLETIDLPS